MASKDLEGIRARTPKADVYYDEPNVNERALRGIAKRTPKRTMTVKDDSPRYERKATMTTRSTGGRKRKSGARAKSERALAAVKRGPESKPATESDTSVREIDEKPREQKSYSAAAKAIPAESTAQKASSPKKRGRLRRVASAVGRGIGRVFKGKGKPSQAQKKDAGQGKSART